MNTATMDELGRVLIKSDIRDALSIEQGSRFSVTIVDGAIVLRPIERVCAICKCPILGDGVLPVCETCVAKIKCKLP